MEEADGITESRLALWNSYHRALEPLEARGLIRRPVVPAHCGHNAHMYYLLLPDLDRRGAFIERLKQAGIHCVFHYVPLDSAPKGRQCGRANGTLVNTHELSDRLVRLPLWVGLEGHHPRVIQEVTRAIEAVSHGPSPEAMQD